MRKQPRRIRQLQLVLEPDNSLKGDGKTFPLKTPGAQQPGLKLKLIQDVSGGITYKLLMHFDASRSIVYTVNGKYILRPVIRTTLRPLVAV